MKILLKAFGCILLLTLTQSCKKDPKPETKPEPIVGVWQIVAFDNVSNQNFNFSWNIKTDHTVDIMSDFVDPQKITGTGTWMVNGNDFILSLKYSGNSLYFHYVANYDLSSNSFTNGQWGFGTNLTNGGTWTVTKK